MDGLTNILLVDLLAELTNGEPTTQAEWALAHENVSNATNGELTHQADLSWGEGHRNPEEDDS